VKAAHVVIGLAYGDEGKGTVVDALVRKAGANTVVVRFNGGGQAGHNVVTPDGRHHTFAQWGSGTFAGARTHLSHFMMVHPTAALREAEVLESKGVPDPLKALTVDSLCLITTPFHQAMNRLRELMRGDNRHGSCGVGVGETVEQAQRGYAIHASDLVSAGSLRTLLKRLRDVLCEEAAEQQVPPSCGMVAFDQVQVQKHILFDPGIFERVVDRLTHFAKNVRITDEIPKDSEKLVFEGAQGVLLDDYYGFTPHTTWSTCTSVNAHKLMTEWARVENTQVIGVLRAFSTRHGAGPFPSALEHPGRAQLLLAGDHNQTNMWQSAFRIGWFDALATRYALECDRSVDSLVLTCLDRVRVNLREWRACIGYSNPPQKQWRIPHVVTTASHLARTRDLMEAKPILSDPLNVHTDEFLGFVEGVASKPVCCVSEGPTAADKVWRGAYAAYNSP